MEIPQEIFEAYHGTIKRQLPADFFKEDIDMQNVDLKRGSMHDYIEAGRIIPAGSYIYLGDVQDIVDQQYKMSYEKMFDGVGVHPVVGNFTAFDAACTWNNEKLMKILKLKEGDLELLYKNQEKQNDFIFMLALTFDEAVFGDKSVMRDMTTEDVEIEQDEVEEVTASFHFRVMKQRFQKYKEARKVAAFTVACNVIMSVLGWYKERQANQEKLCDQIYEQEQALKKIEEEKDTKLNALMDQMKQFQKQFENQIKEIKEDHKKEVDEKKEQIESLKNKLQSYAEPNNLTILSQAAESSSPSSPPSTGELIREAFEKDKQRFAKHLKPVPNGDETTAPQADEAGEENERGEENESGEENERGEEDERGEDNERGEEYETVTGPQTGEKNENATVVANKTDYLSDKDQVTPQKRVSVRKRRAPSRLADQIMVGKTYVRGETSPKRNVKRSKTSPDGVQTINIIHS